MIQGPSAGPAMVLNILMRWPLLIIVLLVGGIGILVYENTSLPQAVASTLNLPISQIIVSDVAEEIKEPKVKPVSKIYKTKDRNEAKNEN